MAFDFKAMITMDETDQFLLPIGRLVWQDLFTPRTFKDEKTGVESTKYSATIAWTKEEMPAVEAVIDAGIGRLMTQPGFPPNACINGGGKHKRLLEQGLNSDQIKTFNRKLGYDHDLDKYPYLENMVVLKANTNVNSAPVIVGRNGFKDRITTDRKDEVYRGCYGIISVALGFHKTTNSLFYKLKGFQKVNEGEPLMSNSSNINIFESFNTGESTFGSVSNEEI